MAGMEQFEPVEAVDGTVDGTVDLTQEHVRAVRATALGRGTHGVPEVRRLVDGALARAFPYRVWVAGRVVEVRTEQRVGLHFTLRASTDDDEPLVLSCLLAEDVLPQVAEVLDRVHDADVSDLVAEGRLARVGGLLRYDAARGTLVLGVSELDPAPAARDLQEQRQAARSHARVIDLRDRQRSRVTRHAPLSVTVVGADDDAAVARTCDLLLASPYAVDLRAAQVPLQGVGAPAEIAGCLREASLRSDLVLLVREPGRPLALGVFDAPEVSWAIGDALVPVVCALGGGAETTASDDVAAVSLPDADAAAGYVLDRLGEAERSLRGLAEEVEATAVDAGTRVRSTLELAREQTDRCVAEAAVRAATARRRRELQVLAVTAVLAVAVVVGSVLSGVWLGLLGLAVLAAALLGARVWSARAMRRGDRPMSQQDDDFGAVLTRLRQVREELSATASPEVVHRLRLSAVELVARGEAILRREVPVA